MLGRRRGSIGIAIDNFRRSEIPLPRRVAVASRNLLTRITRRQTCCGHDGEPGC